MVDQLSSFAAEVTRVAREVGTEGKLGGQAEVKGVAGVWKDLTDSVQFSWPVTSPSNCGHVQRSPPPSLTATSAQKSRWTCVGEIPYQIQKT